MGQEEKVDGAAPRGARFRVEHDARFDTLRVWDASVPVQFDRRPTTPRVQVQYDELGAVGVQVRFASEVTDEDALLIREESAVVGPLLDATLDWLGDRSGGRRGAAYDYPRAARPKLDVAAVGPSDMVDEASPERVAEKRSANRQVRVMVAAAVGAHVAEGCIYGLPAVALTLLAVALTALSVATFLVTFPHYAYWIRRSVVARPRE